jgi:hypothetical protein
MSDCVYNVITKDAQDVIVLSNDVILSVASARDLRCALLEKSAMIAW